MLRLRPYKSCDAAAIVSWLGDERSFRQWCADRFETYPLTADDLNAHYDALAHSDSFYEMTAFDDTGIVGHLIMRFTDPQKKNLRFGFIIVDSRRRGRGYGRRMLKMAVDFGFEMLRAEKITLGVFENNEPARRCYQSVGFHEIPADMAVYYSLLNEEWKCLELEMTRP